KRHREVVRRGRAGSGTKIEETWPVRIAPSQASEQQNIHSVLFGVASLLGCGCIDLSEYSITLVIRSGSEIKIRRRSVHGAVAGEAECPKPINHKRSSVGIEERSPKPSAESVEGVDCAVAEVTDEKPMAEGAEVARSQGDAPGSVQEHVVLQAQGPVSAGAEHSYGAQAGPVIFIFRAGIALGVRDHKIAADILNSEGDEVRRKVGDMK